MSVTIVEALSGPVDTDPTAWVLTTPPVDDTQALLFVYVGSPGLGVDLLTVNGDPNRDYLDLSSGDTIVRLYPLEAADEFFVLTPSTIYVEGIYAALQVSDFAAIPADLVAQIDTDAFVPTDTISVETTMIATGLLVATGYIDPSTAMTVPAGWTLVEELIGTDAAMQIAYQNPTPSGVVSDLWTVGTVPALGAGVVVSFGLGDIGLRFREAGAYIGASIFGADVAGVERPVRQFPEPVTYPRQAPDPTPITVPTPPWDPTRSPHRRG